LCAARCAACLLRAVCERWQAAAGHDGSRSRSAVRRQERARCAEPRSIATPPVPWCWVVSASESSALAGVPTRRYAGALDGMVISMYQDRHRHEEWLKFLRLIERKIPKHLQLHLVVDNYCATHGTRTFKRWQRFLACSCRLAR
jgi:hypothetical protein